MLGSLTAALLIAGVDAEPDGLPKGPPPRVAMVPAKDLRHGAIGHERVLGLVLTEVKVVNGGKRVRQVETRMALRMITHDVERWAEGLQVTTAGGGKVGADELSVLLNRPRVVLNLVRRQAGRPGLPQVVQAGHADDRAAGRGEGAGGRPEEVTADSRTPGAA